MTEQPRDLFKQSIRMVAILVGACVLFVGSLSTVAVVIASKVATTGAPVQSADPSSESSGGSSSPTPAHPTSHAGKKSQSI